MKLTDFKKNATAWVLLTNDYARGKKEDELIEEWEILSVGRKYVTARKKGMTAEYKFKVHESFKNSNALVEATDYFANHYLYSNKQDLLDDIERAKLFKEISQMFSWNNESKYSLKQLRKIKEILDGEK